MTYIGFKIAFVLTLLYGATSLYEVHTTTKEWRDSDIALAKKAESWSPRLDSLLRTNKVLQGIEWLCKAKPTPETLAGLRTWALTLETAQNLQWKILQTEMLLQKIKGVSAIAKSYRSPKGICIQGPLKFDSETVFKTERHYSGIEIQTTEEGIRWQFRHSGVVRRL